MGWQTESVVQLIAGDSIINASGIFTYSSAPAANNLIASVTPAAGTDTFGNIYLQGVTSYGGTVAMQLEAGEIIFYTGSLSAGWTQSGLIFINTNVIELSTSGGVITQNNTLDNGSGGASFGAVAVASLTIGGSSNTGNANLSNSGISGTSGAASAGTAHTHGGGSYAVANDSHHHPL